MTASRLLFLASIIVVSAYASHLSGVPMIAPTDRVSIAGVFAQIDVTMLGFMLAALAVVASISGSELVKTMQKTGHYKDMVVAMFASAGLFLGAAAVACVVMLGCSSSWVLPAAVGLHAAALVTLLRVGWMLWLVLTNLDPS